MFKIKVNQFLMFFLGTLVSLDFAFGATCSDAKIKEILDQASENKKAVSINCSVKLPTSSVITKALNFIGKDASNILFDCSGATINPTFPVQNTVRISSLAKLVDGSAAWSRPENITIKNCNILGAVRIFGMDQNANGSAVEYKQSSKSLGHTQRAQDAAPRGIIIENSKIEGDGRTPLYFAPGVTYSGVRNSTILGTFNSVSVYFDAESSNNFLINNKISSISKPGNDEKKRELIAIDGSANNEISGNYFTGLNYGGIFLYRNCGEGGTVRHQTPNSNLIKNNTFYYRKYSGERPSVWLGSRNGNSSYCDDDKGVPFGSSANNGDFAEKNQVIGNTIYKFKPDTMIVGDRKKNKIESNVQKIE